MKKIIILFLLLVSNIYVYARPIDDTFITNIAEYTIEMFKEAISDEDNSLVSPLSIMLALAMTANGAAGETLSQMETLLGREIPLSDLNEYLHSYIRELPSEEKSKLEIANSIWFRVLRDSLWIKPEFLQTNIEYYNASIHKEPFNEETLIKVNNWVKDNTDGLIEEILKEIDEGDMMYLINAIIFDAEWKKGYETEDVRKDNFYTKDGILPDIDYMHSEENLYLDDGKAIGFIKPYINDHYSFVAILPNIDIDIHEYISSMTGESFLDMINNAQSTTVNAKLPKFEHAYEIYLRKNLINLGMINAFGPADFSRIAPALFISEVIHKTFITVDERGTKAAAATIVIITRTSLGHVAKIVHLDRPFIYAIIDNKTNLPIFIGTVMDL